MFEQTLGVSREYKNQKINVQLAKQKTFRLDKEVSMKKRIFCLTALLFSITVFHSGTVVAEEYGTDVSVYLGRTVQELISDLPDLYSDNDQAGSGRDFLTNGKVGFYYEYTYSETETIEEKKINRIVLYGACGADYCIGQLPGGSTYNDEYMALTNMGYSFLYKTNDMRHFWKDDEDHLIIITRGPWAGASETDYSEVIPGEFWD